MCQEIRFLALLQNALDQPADDRDTFVRAASGDRALAEEALHSLSEIDDLGDFLERPAAVAMAEARSAC